MANYCSQGLPIYHLRAAFLDFDAGSTVQFSTTTELLSNTRI